MYALGTEFEVYETVDNLYKVFENREGHFQTDKVKNNKIIHLLSRCAGKFKIENVDSTMLHRFL